ncbi:putative secreted protein [Pseudoduganella lurida]|uniref:Putative secreted protein n=1 Tax=Pseudoduganella lurida TaxID=1036180 RepID=A0A562RM71_9BURK|nr:PEPxxWA-CTERM sorting domain-containing protein [Pseudoduganella lurida]TWI69556.1 putative secreted protein [Pseudoduganella lurida]
MFRKILLAIAAAILAISANAETLDFEAEAGGYGYYPYSFVEDGFNVNYTPVSVFGFYIIDDPADHLGQCNPACASNGTTAFYSFNESSVTIDRENKGLFSLTSLDVAQTFTEHDRPLTLTLIATGINGTVTTEIFVETKAAEKFSTFTFTNFVDISSLTIVGSEEFPEFAIDNVVLSVSPVPEPASWAMLIAGLGAIGTAVRRKRAMGGVA